MKITKREYTKQMNELTSLIASCNLMIAFRLAEIGDQQVSTDEADSINDMHDQVTRFEQAIKDLDSQWNRRNWTGSDYSTYALIAQNID